LTMSCIGNTISAEINGVQFVEAQDSALEEGNAGFNFQPLGGALLNSGVTGYVIFDNFNIEIPP